MSISVLLASNQSMFVAGIKSLLEEDLEIRIIGTTVKDEELLLLIKEKRPDIVLLDLVTCKQEGPNLERQINSNGLVTSMLVIADHLNSSIIDDLIEMGISGIILKDRIAEELPSAVHKLVRGEKHIPSFTSTNNLNLQSENELGKQKINLPVLSTKLHRPPISNDHIVRSDIIELLEKNLEKLLTLVSAPAVYCKLIMVV